MKGAIGLLIALLIGYAGVTAMQQFKVNTDFVDRVEHQINFVDENSMDSVKQELIADAKRLGIDIVPGDIDIKYEDTEQHTVAQNLVGKKLEMQYINKRVTISVDYVQRILGIPFHKNVTQARIRQIQAPRHEPSPEMKQLLDSSQ